ncbi:AraC family transcriptional regulator [Pseudomonas sp. MUP55]|uniref:AraC family transcriptional regulator n=1 Tax=Pseudomonas sp. MUP55 TaxID=3087234 RepID=UPI002A59DADF|nr:MULTISPECIES: AraC family transcriptional regulator [unclassified Pseudomonas]WPN93575.1 AraC family transcriptional regulator [Pseudomonas sp. MUP56]WPN99101.1 AraC family transcriptional regulator [Pseudomonas sp. MUP55]
MTDFYYSSVFVKDQNAADEHFDSYCCNLKVTAGPSGKLEYSSKICLLGASFASTSSSPSGWGYETKGEQDGFLITIPHVGHITWKTNKSTFQSKENLVFLGDQREVVSAEYSENVNYTTLYIDHLDMHRYLALILGEPPKSRIFFNNPSATTNVATCLTSIAKCLLDISKDAPSTSGRILSHLKESLISYTLYNLENNYSNVIHDQSQTLRPSPYCIRQVANYIDNNYKENITVAQLAGCAGISIRSLQLGFKTFKNITPMAYLRDIRLQHARQLLISGQYQDNIKFVAKECGFNSYYLFTRYYSARHHEQPIDTFRNSLLRRS